MRILICGAGGFVGRHLEQALSAAKHEVLRGVRRPLTARDVAIDFTRDTEVELWQARLAGVDAVVNAVGVLRDTPTTPMALIHDRVPRALFTACAESGVSRIVHFSALGVGGQLATRYFSSREAAERHLQSLPDALRSLILRPSLIHGAGGASTRLFLRLARLPLLALPGGLNARVQPVHIDDITQAIVRWLGNTQPKQLGVAAVGAEAVDLGGLLASYRSQLGRKPARVLPLPRGLVKLAARLGDRFPSSMLCSDTLRMLEAGNSADPAAFAALLGRPPLSFREFL
ncbi:MAG: hypothetical protein B7Y40_05745 [Gammaproteobacteria bacterium 28-57-27]|nr:MAG: hypothetical protein B7Y40_05745 [Gammaproteobacteria bacterium 28-57-27]